MANYYTDIPELKYHLNNPMMKRICELKERNYRDKDEFDYAPLDFEDAVDSYDKVLEITGEITGEIIAANAEGVDEEGPHCANGRVEYASGTKQNLDAMVKAGLNGMTSVRWTELPDYSVHHVCRNRSGCRCRFRQHLVIAGLHRNIIRIR